MITFDDSETIKAPDGPIYIYAKIVEILSGFCLVDPTSLVNVITKENVFMKGLQHDFYDTSYLCIQTCNGFLYPSFGSIDLLIELCGKL